MAAKPRTTYHHGDLRHSLIEGAIALINEVGIGDVSLRQVARRIGVSHNAPYRHFADKEALLAAVAEEGFKALGSAMEAAQQQLPPGSAASLTAIGMAYVNFALAHPAHYRVMFSEFRGDITAYAGLLEAGQQAFMVLVSTISQGQAEGIFRAADPLAMARFAWALVHGQAMLILDQRICFQSAVELEDFLHCSSQWLINGIERPEEAPVTGQDQITDTEKDAWRRA